MLDTVVFENSLRQWLVAAGIALAVLLLVALFLRVLLRRLRWLADRTSTSLDNAAIDALEGTRYWLWVLPAINAGTLALVLPARIDRLVAAAAMLSLLVQVGIWASRLVDHWSMRSHQQAGSNDKATRSGIAVLRFVGKLLAWSILLLLALDNLGVDVTAAVAGLGIGGIAVALAVQNILGDLFASLSIVIDKPFEVGDFLVVGDFSGTVEQIGLKTTRLRSLSGEEIVFPNSDLLQSRLRNYKTMYERRVTFRFGVICQTTPEQLEAIQPFVADIIKAQPDVRFDRVHFMQFGPSSYDFEAVYYVLSGNFNVYMDRHQAIHLALLRGFIARDIHLAYPTQTLYVSRLPGDQAAQSATPP